MTKNYSALTTELDTNARYDTAVQGKSLQPLMALLNTEESGQVVAQAVSSDDVREAIGDGIRGLSAAQIQTLRLMIPDDGRVDFRKANIRNEIREVLSGKTAALDRLRDVATRTRTYGEAFGFENVNKQDLWKVLPDIAKSYMATYLARG